VRRAAFLLVALTLSAGVAAEAPVFDAAAIDLGGLEARSAALMLSGQQGGDLEVAVIGIPAPTREPGGTSEVLLVVDLPGPPLLAAFGGAGDRLLELYVYALDDTGALRATLTRAVDLDLPGLDDRLAAAGVKLFASLDLPAGELSLRVLALHRSSGRLGLGTLRLLVPTWSGGEPRTLPPVLREPAGSWILVREAGREAPPFPLSLGGEPQVPSAARTLTAGRPAAVFLFGRGLADGLVLRLQGDRLLELDLGEPARVELGDLGLEVAAAAFEAGGLAPGEIEVQLAAGDLRGPPVSWTLRPAESTAAEAPPPPVRRAPRRGAGGRIGEAYRALAAALATGDEEEGRRRLSDLHVEELGSGATEERARLLEAELIAAAELASGRAEALLPLADLHLDLHRRHHRDRRYGLATHARQVGLALADLYLARSEAAHAEELIAAALVGLAVYLRDAGDVLNAERVYERALEVHPDHPAALMGLGAIQERRGKLDRAADLFAKLVAVDPGDAEARLHHAVVLGRSERRQEAEEALGALLEMPGPPWIEVLATQELAGLLAARGERERAVGVLERALGAHPDHGGLRIQLASLHDRAGRPGEAFAVLAPLAAAAGDGGPTPRSIYGQVSRERAERDRRRLAAAVEERREDLRAAAGMTAEGGG
jgi:tetratricopeptide (TPR) repeat protein